MNHQALGDASLQVETDFRALGMDLNDAFKTLGFERGQWRYKFMVDDGCDEIFNHQLIVW